MVSEAHARALLQDAEGYGYCGLMPSQKQLAAKHKVSTSTVSRLLGGKHRFSYLDLCPSGCGGSKGDPQPVLVGGRYQCVDKWHSKVENS